MEYTRLGSTGMKVSRICPGCMSFGQPTEGGSWTLDEAASRPYIQRALELASILRHCRCLLQRQQRGNPGRRLRTSQTGRGGVLPPRFVNRWAGSQRQRSFRKHTSSIDASLKRLGRITLTYTNSSLDYETHRRNHGSLPRHRPAGKARYIGAFRRCSPGNLPRRSTPRPARLDALCFMQNHYNPNLPRKKSGKCCRVLSGSGVA